PVDYESLAALGAIMGSGGMVVMDQDNCMVDVARYFIEFTYSESCGKCTPCREGLAQMLELLNRITRGSGEQKDINTLERLAYVIKDSSLCGLGQTSSNPVLTTLKHFRNEYEEHINDKRCDAGVCENLFLAPCENSCPMHMNIPGYLQLLKEGKLEDAFELTLRDNPLPGTVGRICYFHCKMQCRREMVDEPVSQGEIHRYLADTMYKMGKEKAIYKRLVNEKLKSTGKKIAIVGAGPSGLAAAFYLVRLGHAVTVYDKNEKAGGILRYGIPEYRLPKDVLDKELSVFKMLGVRFVFKTEIGKDIKFEKLMKENDIVFTAIGAQKDTSLGIPGENLGGVFPGYEFLEDFAKGHIKKVGKKAVIIGAGNVAIDAARTLLRLGSDVTIVYRRDRDEMPANEHEILDAEAEKIKFRFMCAPEKLVGDSKGCVAGLEVKKMKFEGFDKAGRKKPVASDETETIPCDMVILAIGEKVDFKYADKLGVAVQKNGSIKVNPHTFKTTNDKIYAGGDAVTGPATVSEAMGIAIRAAETMDFELMKEHRFKKMFRQFDYKDEVPAKPEGGRQSKVKTLAAKERVRNFQEVMKGYTGEQAMREAVRCLRCDVKECVGAKK
ncbi:MAG TPA: FAD-dependent oxidoreductase, partial [Firmicutes bacterium]|nr:FAD-dependent oxidoreductase [Bacillota bacterium]